MPEYMKSVNRRQNKRIRTEQKEERTEFELKFKEKALVSFRLVLTLFVS
jgi:hypothetical protein